MESAERMGMRPVINEARPAVLLALNRYSLGTKNKALKYNAEFQPLPAARPL